ncbi:enoyl-[acyl-carrier protein] reductase III [Streptomyces sp. V4I23]|uniref:SDR family oxidoreductase n=1 Tax=Streptomyces sp. V4I23 TaxID=3042282 RepID=UPI00278ACEF1|nr:SDR family oxidoreductase [Streptomyces sp. V4I23]MDQ1008562.1 enoyl-[acyl-carrier protein] reductase III [Streptomyces sp. V4I23]
MADLGLDTKVALVTGATRGVGLAVARKLCAAGATVVLNYARSEDDARRAVEELAALKGGAVALRADVTRPEELDRLLRQVRERYGRLDVLVHNAASWNPAPAVGADPAGVRADLSAALDPLLHGAPAIAELMAGGPGRIVAISSSGAHSVVPRYVGLGVAKAALESLVRYLAVELAGRGIAVNAVSTSKIDKGAGTPQPEVAAALAARTPAGRLTTPEDIADAVALLCTPEAGWIHGQVITADGGLGLRG